MSLKPLARLIAVSLAALTIAAAPQPGNAAGPRPLFQLPFACGETWTLATYRGHDDYDIDMTATSGVSENRPILASYGGTVGFAGYDTGGGNMVRINHGNGWQTIYLHMIAPAIVSTGQTVVQGQQLGRVGHTGANSSTTNHLHFEELADGNKTESYFNGVPSGIRSDGDPDTGPLYISGPISPAVNVTSRNCGSGAPTGMLRDLTLDGLPDLLTREASTGNLRVYPHTGNVNAPFTGSGNVVGNGYGGMDSLSLADLTLDGRADLLTRVAANGELRLWAHTGIPSAPFTGNGTVVGSDFSQMDSINLADVNWDGRTDLVVRVASTGDLRVYYHTGNPAAPFTGTGTLIGTGYETMNSINVGDLTLDGFVDLLVRVAATGQLKLYPHTTNVNAPYTGSGIVIGDSGFGSMTAINLSDLNLDGKTDLLVRTAAGDLRLYPHTGNVSAPFTGSGILVGTGYGPMTDID
ncbi:hypothetical protein Rhe02_56350 [Rhizocola hellebori]|uniref:M23ase beta-sheet core domain-containing protein n=1 Tax=Rhizocola hellebori TaxID=1392758 RepID=A0A8J3QD87_9ACTN|nr:peptidoglycan DD-metalloendopeptidase family protein [Rhizocola hellebori]GIH07568.1 hypothetical protein Rhe02_56350 [Rhizocola hellebori]